tara:strand:+ start:1430 stop:1666 length:237 start_codon:yes stop_codon:yes gene_type:complete
MSDKIKNNWDRVCMIIALLYFITLSYSDTYITNVHKREKIKLESEYNYLMEKQKEAYKTITILSEKIGKLKNQNKDEE